MATDDGGLMRLRRSPDGILQNVGDSVGDYLDAMPIAIQEFRAETIALSLRMFARGGGWRPAKVCKRRVSEPAARDDIGASVSVYGYITLLKFLVGRSPAQMERMLGFRPGVLAAGADVFTIEGHLAAGQFAPRGTTAWSGGISPRDLERYRGRPHPNYPSAGAPVYQWVIYRHRPVRARKIATLNYAEPLSPLQAWGGGA